MLTGPRGLTLPPLPDSAADISGTPASSIEGAPLQGSRNLSVFPGRSKIGLKDILLHPEVLSTNYIMNEEESPESASMQPTRTETAPRRKRERYITDPLARKAKLESDPFTENVTAKRVRCRGCGQTVALDKRNTYYLGLWTKHRDRCNPIREAEGKSPTQRKKRRKTEADEVSETSSSGAQITITASTSDRASVPPAIDEDNHTSWSSSTASLEDEDQMLVWEPAEPRRVLSKGKLFYSTYPDVSEYPWKTDGRKVSCLCPKI